jgi:protease I
MAKIAIPVGDDFEDSEFTVSCDRLREAGHHVTVFGSKAGEVFAGKRRQATARIEKSARDIDPASFDALVIPGGHSPDKLRLDEDVVSFVKRFAETGKPIAAVCHGPQLLIEAGVVSGRTLTSWPSVRKDLENAGARWQDAEVVEDDNLITSRKPEDMDAFCSAILQRL